MYLFAGLGSLVMAGFAWLAAPLTPPVLIPLPARFARLEGSFALAPKTVIDVATPEADSAQILAERTAG
jgi:hypothetical protein